MGLPEIAAKLLEKVVWGMNNVVNALFLSFEE